MKVPACFSRRAQAGVLALLVGLANLHGSAAQAQTDSAPLVRVTTEFGPIDVQLDSRAPATVANFLTYLRNGSFDGTVLHRLMPGFVLQGGGFRWNDAATPRAVPVTTNPPVVNEFSPLRSNLRGTVAMAKLGGNPDSATSQWFVNLGNNAANLDNQNGGFTVFGRVTAPAMQVVDRIAALGKVNAAGCTGVLGSSAGAMSDLPVRPPPPTFCADVTGARVVLLSSARELAPRSSATDSERIFDYLEAAYPSYAAPASAPTLVWEGYTFRYYATTDSYAGTRDGVVYYMVPALGPEITPLGSVAEWLAIAKSNGY
jgi:peptidyl-prolyl cis-trans isomerase A (cyclophilin A)